VGGRNYGCRSKYTVQAPSLANTLFYRPDAKYRYSYMFAACYVAGQCIFYNGINGLT